MTKVPEGSLTAPLAHSRRLPVKTLQVRLLAADGGLTEPEREGEVVTVGSAPGNDLIVDDRTVSGYHLELRVHRDGVEVQDLGSTNGTFVEGVRLRNAIIPPKTTILIGRSRLIVGRGAEGEAALSALEDNYGLIGESVSMQRLFARIEKVASAKVGALLFGESGTGKELVARALHQLSARKKAPFVTVDCGAISPHLVASELFGHERGAFTGATAQRIGAFERANGGFLFLDEIGELPSSLQPQLLGVLERGRFQRVGGSREICVDVRVVSATHRDLRREVNEGSYRLDLYYRIAQVVLELPSLRDRRDDIPLLLTHFLRECGETAPLEELIPPPKMEELQQYRWPGNVRELRNWVEATLALGELSELQIGNSERLQSAPEADTNVAAALGSGSYKDVRARVLHDFESDYLKALIHATGGNVSAAARQAKMDRTYLIKLLARHGMR